MKHENDNDNELIIAIRKDIQGGEMDLFKVWTVISGQIKKHKYLMICFIMLFLLGLGVFSVFSQTNYVASYDKNEIYADTQDGQIFTNELSDDTAGTIQSIRIPGVKLDKGLYQIIINYETNTGGTVTFSGNGRDARSRWYNDIPLSGGKTQTSAEYWANDSIEDFHINVVRSEGTLVVKSVIVQTAWNSKLYQIVCLIIKLCLVAGVCFLILNYKFLRKHAEVIVGIAGITFICSIGLFTRYMISGHDTMFHLNRIEGLKDGILAGMFPVRVQPTWNNGWGYAVSQMYGDLAIVFPALMRLCGFTIQTTWKTFMVVVNLATALIAYYSFQRIVKNQNKALLVTLLYCTGLYRMACIYIRAAVGEFAVMIFLPLVVLGFWYAFTEDVDSDDYGKKLLAPIIGFTGMIQTHLLTCEMSAIFIVFLCLILIKKVLRKKTFFYLFKILLGTILVNLWFLVPLISLYKEDIVISQATTINNDFQMWGLSVTELFATMASGAYGFTFSENISLVNKCTFTIGLALWGAVFLVLILLLKKKISNVKPVGIMFVFGILSAFMATNLFPYRDLIVYFPKFFVLFSKIQFPFRFLGMVNLFFSVMLLFALYGVKSKKVNRSIKVFLIIIGVVAIFQGMDYQYQFLYGGSAETKYSTASLVSTGVTTGEYLYIGTNNDATETEQSVTGSEVDIREAKLHYLEAEISCRTTAGGAYVEVPRYYYPGYVAYDEKGTYYIVSRSSNNNRIRVDLPDNFDGKLTVVYKEPIYWRICEAISLLTLICLLCVNKIERFVLKMRGKNEKWENPLTKNVLE